MPPIKLTLTNAGQLSGDVPLPSEPAAARPVAPHAGDRDLRPEEVVWSSDRTGPGPRPLHGDSLFPAGLTSTGFG